MSVNVQAIGGTRVFYPRNSQDMKVEGVQDIDTGSFWNVPTLTGNLFDQYGNLVLGPVVMSYIPSSNGDYSGVCGDANFNPPPGKSYVMTVEGDNAGIHLFIDLLAEVAPRTG